MCACTFTASAERFKIAASGFKLLRVCLSVAGQTSEIPDIRKTSKAPRHLRALFIMDFIGYNCVMAIVGAILGRNLTSA